MRIAILTGGGDVPGLNVCIKAITKRASELGWEVIGFRRGWAGPLHCNPDDPDSIRANTVSLTREFVRKIDRAGGTILHTSRIDPRSVKAKDLPDFLRAKAPKAGAPLDCSDHVLKVLEHLKIDALILSGGDGTLRFGAYLHGMGFKVISIPKTMDNDVFGTDYCIGFSTAITRSVEAITALRTTAGSHERIAVVELFGRNSGETALVSGYLADADRVAIAEVPVDTEQLARLVAEDREANPSHYAMVIVSEGTYTTREGPAPDSLADLGKTRYHLGGIGAVISDEIERLTGIGVINQRLAYLMRSGAPDALDRMVANSFANLAVQLLQDGQTGLMTALQDGKYTAVDVDVIFKGSKRVDVNELYDEEAYRPRIARIANKPMFLY